MSLCHRLSLCSCLVACACRYDFSPIMLRLVEGRQSWLYFLTSVCAILGGVFALAGVLDTIFYRVAETAKTK